MNTKEHLMSYMVMTNHELEELRGISWPQNREELKSRMFSLEKFLQTTIKQLKEIDQS